MFLEVALPLPLHRTFYYRCEKDIFESAQPAQRVLVPFQNRKLMGFVVKAHAQLPAEIQSSVAIKNILKVVDSVPVIPASLFKLSHWVADYYFASLGEVLKACLPPGSSLKSQKRIKITPLGEEVAEADGAFTLNEQETRVLKILAQKKSLTPLELKKDTGIASVDRLLIKLLSKQWVTIDHAFSPSRCSEKTQRLVSLVSSDVAIPKELKLSTGQLEVLKCLQNKKGPIALTELLAQLKCSRPTVSTLQKKGLIRITSERLQRDPYREIGHSSSSVAPEHTSEQRTAITDLSQALQAASFSSWLLHGVTGSGKTEIYLTLIEQSLVMGKTCLILMPEIGLTPRVAQEFRGRLKSASAILHSGLSHGERFDEWWRIRRGEAKVVIGTRSAVFAPLDNIGLIIVDEEHDPSFKQHESPRYHGRDTALVRGKQENAVVILGSATPSVETFFNAKNGKYQYLRLASRVQDRPLPDVTLVDMREEFKAAGKKPTLSNVLKEQIQARLERKEQTLVLLNRRGYSASVLCRHCGQSIRCRNCSITLTYHKSKNGLVCHYCSYQQAVPGCCTTCGSEHLYFLGEGTEKIEAVLDKIFPRARIARLDRDTARKKNAHLKILRQVQTGEVDILTGTQMISKGHDFHQVTLVGILSADTVLSLPDFRSAERTFQLFSQMSGRAGRGELAGQVLIQTYFPEHYCLQFVRKHDYEGFFEKELKFRKLMHYPPFTAMANILSRDRNLDRAVRLINSFADVLSLLVNANTRILGPALSPLARLKNEHRYQILIKAETRQTLKELLQRCLAQGEKQGIDFSRLQIDIDPIDLM